MISLICGVNFDESSPFRNVQSYSHLKENDHLENISENSFFKEYINFSKSLFINESNNQSLSANLNEFIQNYLNRPDVEKFELLSLGISCLQAFVGINWLGPIPVQFSQLPSALTNIDLSKPNLSLKVLNLIDHFQLNSKDYKQYDEITRKILSIDGETLFPIVKCAHLLLLSKFIFLDFHDHFIKIERLVSWWSLRLIFLYQQLLEERSSSLNKLALELLVGLKSLFNLESAESLSKTLDESIFNFASICFNTEIGHFYYQTYNWSLGQESFKKALNLSKLNFELIGVYGKRTKYQQKDLAQLFLKFTSLNQNQCEEKITECSKKFSKWKHSNINLAFNELPKDLMLNDDTLLNKVKISNSEDEKDLFENVKTMSQLEQVVLYCSLIDFQKNSPHHELTFEEMSPFIEILLSNPQNWCVQASSLFTRTKLEVKNVRKMERSLLQLENLVDSYKQPNDIPDTKKRFQFFYSVAFPPFWVVQKELCKFYMQLGLINSSLEIYLSLEMWDDVIKCYQVLEKRDKAEELIRQQLAIKETPDLYCSLGEVTRNEEYFHKAIELSNGRSARAYRILAKHFFFKEQRYAKDDPTLVSSCIICRTTLQSLKQFS